MQTIRLNNFRLLIEQHGSQKKLHIASGIDLGYISQLNKEVRSIGEKTARRIETALSLPHLWMDTNGTDESNAVDQELRELWSRVEDAGMTDVVKNQIEALLKTLESKK